MPLLPIPYIMEVSYRRDNYTPGNTHRLNNKFYLLIYTINTFHKRSSDRRWTFLFNCYIKQGGHGGWGYKTYSHDRFIPWMGKGSSHYISRLAIRLHYWHNTYNP